MNEWKLEVHNGLGPFKTLKTRIVDRDGREVCSTLNRWSPDHGVANAALIMNAIESYEEEFSISLYKKQKSRIEELETTLVIHRDNIHQLQVQLRDSIIRIKELL